MDFKGFLIIAAIIVITLMNIEDFLQNRERDELQQQVNNLELKIDNFINTFSNDI